MSCPWRNKWVAEIEHVTSNLELTIDRHRSAAQCTNYLLRWTAFWVSSWMEFIKLKIKWNVQSNQLEKLEAAKAA